MLSKNAPPSFSIWQNLVEENVTRVDKETKSLEVERMTVICHREWLQVGGKAGDIRYKRYKEKTV